MLGGFLNFNNVILHEMVDGYRVAMRNFYGQLRVNDEGDPRFDEDAVRNDLDPARLKRQTRASIRDWNELGRGLCGRFLAAANRA